MAVYKVPQDVEAEDKLLGPFSFRQFIYLVVAVLAGGLAYFLGTIFIGLAIIPLPMAIIFLILALPLKKDQPMEVYAAAILAFYLKPRRKLWEPDGILTLVEFTNDGPAEKEYSPDITFNEARQRISYLSNLVDSNGEIIKSQTVANPSLQSDIIAESTQIEDIHDDDAFINQKFDAMINRHNQARREQIIENLNLKDNQLNDQPTQVQNYQLNNNPQSAYQNIVFPVPTSSIHQNSSVFPNQPPMPPSPYPASDQPWTYNNLSQSLPQNSTNQFQIPQPTYQPQPDFNQSFDNHFPNQPPTELVNHNFNPSPDIINLANNNDLSVQTLATEAKKIADRNKKLLGEEEEIIISLR